MVIATPNMPINAKPADIILLLPCFRLISQLSSFFQNNNPDENCQEEESEGYPHFKERKFTV